MAKSKKHQEIIDEGHERFEYVREVEAPTRAKQDADHKFVEGDSDNRWQWPTRLAQDRDTARKPVLTINRVRQHCLQITNDEKQNKPGVTVRPTGAGASFKAAKAMQMVVDHIEYISNAEAAYDWGTEMQVKRGIGYWRVVTDYADDESFDQEIFIRRIENPKSVYLDPDIKEADGSDAYFGFVFDDVPLDRFKLEYPKHADLVDRAKAIKGRRLGRGRLTSGGDGFDSEWMTENHIRVAEYYRRIDEPDELILLVDDQGEESVVRKSVIPSDILALAIEEMEERGEFVRRRPIKRPRIEWYKIAGDEVIEKTDWPGIYIPIVRVIGEETKIDGVIDRKGHVRALKDAQRMYNYNTSAATEFGALQTKTPWIVAIESVEGFEQFWRDANTANRAYLPFRSVDDEGVVRYPPPTRPAPPAASEVFTLGMATADREMMMASGQYEANFGQQGNEKSGVAINERQRQGDNATYHYIDNQAVAIRFTGRILIDLIPKIYDTERVMQIKADDGTEQRVEIKPQQDEALREVETPPEVEGEDPGVILLFNPNVGKYMVQSDIGPAYATRRQEAFNALTALVGTNPDMMTMFGDLYFRTADFAMADEMADRAAKMVPAHLKGKGPTPEMQQMQQQVDQLTQLIEEMIKDGAQKELEAGRISADRSIQQQDADTRRLAVVKEFLAAHPEMLDDLVSEAMQEAIEEPGAPMPGAERGRDGKWYVRDEVGGWRMIETAEDEPQQPPGGPQGPQGAPGGPTPGMGSAAPDGALDPSGMAAANPEALGTQTGLGPEPTGGAAETAGEYEPV